jgi:hypothetical protein
MALIIDAYAAALKGQGKQDEAEELRAEAQRARNAADLVVRARPVY